MRGSGLSRRRFIKQAGGSVLATSGLGTFLAACGGGGGGGGAGAAGPKTITVAVGSFMSPGVEMFRKEWEEKTGNTVRVVQIPYGDLYQRLFTAFSTGAEQFDVAVYAANLIPEFAGAGHILALDRYYPEKTDWDAVLQKVKDTTVVNGKQYSVPLDGDIIFGYYRKDALENDQYANRFAGQYGYDLAPPQTWQQYRDIAEFFNGWDWAKSGGENYGLLMAQKPKDVGQYLMASQAAAYAAHPDIPGSLYFDPESMEPQVNNPGWVQALQDWIDWKKLGPSQMANYAHGDMLGNFASGNYALAVNWADLGITAQDPKTSKVKGKIGYFLMPGSERVWNLKTKAWDELSEPNHAPHLAFGGWHGSVTSKSENADAAWDFLDFIDSKKTAFAAVTTPGTARNPYRTDHFEDAKAWETSPTAYEDPKPFLDVQMESLDHPNAQPELRIPKAGRYLQTLDQWVQAALAGSSSPQEALDKAAEDWKRITDEAGVDEQREFYRGLYPAIGS